MATFRYNEGEKMPHVKFYKRKKFDVCSLFKNRD